MAEQYSQSETRSAGRSKLLAGFGIAVIFAAGLLVIFILPAEYGIDPTGLGKRMGLVELGSGESSPGPVSNAAVDPAIGDDEEFVPPSMYTKLPTPPGTAVRHDDTYRSDMIDIVLETGEELEYKVTLEQGEPLLYAWEIDQDEAEIYYDFHGEPTENESMVFMSYEEGEGRSGQGYLIAPFTGNHGWYWLNYNDEPVTMKLTVNGYYTWLGKVGAGDEEGQQH